MFIDVLDALCLRMMVQEQIKLEKEKKRNQMNERDSLDSDSIEREEEDFVDTEDKEINIRNEIVEDIMKFEVDEASKKIQKVKELQREQSKIKATSAFE